MGSVLGQALIASKTVKPEQVVVYDHGADKKHFHRGIRFVKNEQEVVDDANVIFLCVRPLEVVDVARGLRPLQPPLGKGAKKNQFPIIISIAAGVSLTSLQKYFGSYVIRIMPSYTQRVLAGPILYCRNDKTSPHTLEQMVQLMRFVGDPMEVPEKFLETATDLTGCSPAFWAYLLHVFIEEAARRGLPREVAERAAKLSMHASVQAFMNEKDLITVVDCVATPGGITREGVRVLEREFPKTMKRVFDATERKYRKLHQFLEGR